MTTYVEAWNQFIKYRRYPTMDTPQTPDNTDARKLLTESISMKNDLIEKMAKEHQSFTRRANARNNDMLGLEEEIRGLTVALDALGGPVEDDD